MHRPLSCNSCKSRQALEESKEEATKQESVSTEGHTASISERFEYVAEKQQFIANTVSENVVFIQTIKRELTSFVRSHQTQTATILELKAQNASFQTQLLALSEKVDSLTYENEDLRFQNEQLIQLAELNDDASSANKQETEKAIDELQSKLAQIESSLPSKPPSTNLSTSSSSSPVQNDRYIPSPPSTYHLVHPPTSTLKTEHPSLEYLQSDVKELKTNVQFSNKHIYDLITELENKTQVIEDATKLKHFEINEKLENKLSSFQQNIDASNLTIHKIQSLVNTNSENVYLLGNGSEKYQLAVFPFSLFFVQTKKTGIKKGR